VPFRLLIADDNATVRLVLRALLETHDDWEVCGEAANGLEAVAKAAELQPDLIILDLAMPLMDGIHAALKISTVSPHLPIILHTMHRFDALELEAKKAGIRQVINKTDNGSNLMAAVEELLKDRKEIAEKAVPGASAATSAAAASDSPGPAATDADPSTKPN
jgi:DNA-binding NarL/FixJ family response regulator